MIKHLLLACSLILGAGLASAQNDCSNGRYQDTVFQQVLITPGLPFGLAPANFDTLGVPGSDTLGAIPLFMDVYQGLLDTGTTNRPVIVFAFGGAFVYGVRVSPDVVKLCNQYAQLGYVAISIDYRLSDELLIRPTAANAAKAVLKGTHDMKAAIRYLRRQATELGNILRIDTNQIYVGGVSAGAFCAIHSAYLDENEMPPVLQSYASKSGGLEGKSGNPGYSSKVAGVINLCGAIGDTTWIQPGDVPIVSMHGTADGTVPYDADTITILNINYFVHGSASIHRHLNHLNDANPTNQIENAFYTWYGADHVPFVTDSDYFDTTFRFTREFMYTQVCSNSSGVKEFKGSSMDLKIFPNPTRDVFKVVALEANFKATLIDPQGKTIQSKTAKGVEADFDMTQLPAGVYLVNVVGNKIQTTSRIIKE